jgi:hypothetical protein
MNPGNTNICDEITLKRRQIIEDHLDEVFPNVIGKIICTYDCYLSGSMTSFDCYLKRSNDYRPRSIVCCIYALRDGRIVVGGDNIWKIFDSLTGRCDCTYTNQSGIAGSIAELPDGRIVIRFGGLQNDQLQIWNLKTKKCDDDLAHEYSSICEIVVLLDGRIMGYGYDYSNGNRKLIINIWKLDNSLTERLVIDASFSNYMSKCYTADTSLKMFPNGQIMVITNHHTLALWNPQTKDIQIISKNIYSNVDNILMLSNGQIIIMNHNSLKICVNVHHKNNNNKKENFRIFEIENKYVFNTIELPDERIAYLCYNGDLKIYDLRNNICDMVLPIHPVPGIITTLPSGIIVCATQKGIITVVS